MADFLTTMGKVRLYMSGAIYKHAHSIKYAYSRDVHACTACMHMCHIID